MHSTQKNTIHDGNTLFITDLKKIADIIKYSEVGNNYDGFHFSLQKVFNLIVQSPEKITQLAFIVDIIRDHPAFSVKKQVTPIDLCYFSLLYLDYYLAQSSRPSPFIFSWLKKSWQSCKRKLPNAEVGFGLVEATLSIGNRTFLQELLFDTTIYPMRGYYSALHWVARGRSRACIALMFPKARLHSVQDSQKVTMLHLFACYGDIENSDYLAQANINAQDALQRVPLHYAAGNGQHEFLAFLLKKYPRGLQVNAPDSKGRTPLHSAAMNGYENCIKELLACKRVNKNICDNDGRGALFYAVGSNHIKCTKALVQYGVNLQKKDIYGRSALHYAAADRSVEQMLMLIEHGIKVNSQDDSGRTAVHYAAIYGCHVGLGILIAQGVQVEKRDRNHRTAMHFAAKSRSLRSIKKLLSCSIDINALDNYGRSPLFYAIESGHAESMRIFLDHAGVDFCVKDYKGHTPLHFLSRINLPDHIKAFIARGADPNAQDNSKKTSLYYAKKYGHVDCADILSRSMEKNTVLLATAAVLCDKLKTKTSFSSSSQSSNNQNEHFWVNLLQNPSACSISEFLKSLSEDHKDLECLWADLQNQAVQKEPLPYQGVEHFFFHLVITVFPMQWLAFLFPVWLEKKMLKALVFQARFEVLSQHLPKDLPLTQEEIYTLARPAAFFAHTREEKTRQYQELYTKYSVPHR